MRPAILFLLLLAILGGCSHVPVEHDTTEGIGSEGQLDSYTIPSLPHWTEKYDPQPGDGRKFEISMVMRDFGLSRLQVVGLQNHYRDLTAKHPRDSKVKLFNQALAMVREDRLESGLTDAQLRAAPLIVVFDMDETLLAQYYGSGERCHSFSVTKGDGTVRYVQLTPGWREIMEGIHALGGLVVLFSANVDSNVYENLPHWLVDGRPIMDSGLIDGVMSNSHLVQQEVTEGPGAVIRSKGRPVMEPSKDMRIFDPTLEKVVIVDDNPLRLFQFENVRTFKMFDADAYCTGSAEVRAFYQQALPAVLEEIRESVSWMRGAGAGHSFQDAYLPYTARGIVAVDSAIASQGLSRAQAIQLLRRSPSLANARY